MCRTRGICSAIIAVGVVLSAIAAWSADSTLREEDAAEQSSPWLVLPTCSSEPKLVTSLGVLGAYLHYFDGQSQVSMFGTTAQYSSTDYLVGGVFATTSFGADHHRTVAFAGSYLYRSYVD